MKAAVQFAARGDWRLEEGPSGPRVVIPTRPIRPLAVFLGLWLCGWAAGEVFALKVLASADWLVKAFLLFWLTFWTAGGLFSGAMLLATCGLARELLWRDGRALCHRWEVLGLGWTFRYDAEAMGPLDRPDPPPDAAPRPAEGGAMAVEGGAGPLRPSAFAPESGADWRGGSVTGGLSFLYKGKLRILGAGLDQGQAARLSRVLSDRLRLR